MSNRTKAEVEAENARLRELLEEHYEAIGETLFDDGDDGDDGDESREPFDESDDEEE